MLYILGHCVVQLRLIFRLRDAHSALSPFLAYVQRFDFISQPSSSAARQSNNRTAYPESSTQLYVLKRSVRSDGSRLGDVIPLDRVRSPVQLVPRFGSEADSRLTMQTSLEYSTEYLLNKYETKELYWSLYSTST